VLDLVIVTGASKGIGKSIAKKCSRISKNMIAIARNIGTLNKVDSKKCNLIKLQGDLLYYRDLHNSIVEEIEQLDGEIKTIGLVLGGGTIGEPGGIFDSDMGQWSHIYETNVLGNLSVIRACRKQLEEGAKLRAVLFSGGGAAYGFPDFSSYALTKVATVRAAENVSMEFEKLGYDASIIAMAPGAVNTDILKKVMKHGGYVKTQTDISEPTNFVYDFLQDKMPTKEMSGRFFHVRDDIESADLSDKEKFTLRRIQ